MTGRKAANWLTQFVLQLGLNSVPLLCFLAASFVLAMLALLGIESLLRVLLPHPSRLHEGIFLLCLFPGVPFFMLLMTARMYREYDKP